jgi:hypothetical protein
MGRPCLRLNLRALFLINVHIYLLLAFTVYCVPDMYLYYVSVPEMYPVVCLWNPSRYIIIYIKLNTKDYSNYYKHL